jgi:hypothetical protein
LQRAAELASSTRFAGGPVKRCTKASGFVQVSQSNILVFHPPRESGQDPSLLAQRVLGVPRSSKVIEECFNVTDRQPIGCAVFDYVCRLHVISPRPA